MNWFRQNRAKLVVYPRGDDLPPADWDARIIDGEDCIVVSREGASPLHAARTALADLAVRNKWDDDRGTLAEFGKQPEPPPVERFAIRVQRGDLTLECEVPREMLASMLIELTNGGAS
jgi:hypothetical protein